MLNPPEDLELDALARPAEALLDAVCVLEINEGTALVTVARTVEVTPDEDDEATTEEDD